MGAIQALCSSWKLKCLADRSRISRVAPVTVDNSPADIEDELAPFALLSLLTTSFTKFLIRRGIDSYHRDEAGLRALGRQRTRKNTPVKRLLTPSHIHRGLLHNAPQSAEDAAVLLALAPLGISLPNIPETAGDDGDATAAHS
ncbi:hypothetical protein PHLCEN_2v13610 [Hermanssonia centrifuga]|uniref:Uncharacterized protein n=1 Tax=Hermanssonia centrifuga TaxID=98765 RepID=A0A2R6NDV3_9APHY|nr:hypothetical protein PHLCEN_2v13610 [Hermanssonia centrifuga]